MTDLHETIMNLQPRGVMRGGLGDTYRYGFKDARHAAAELARAARPAMTEAEERAAFEAKHKNWSLMKTYSLCGLISYSEPLLEERWLAWQARAALSAPAGFKLVPIEPTPEMFAAAQQKWTQLGYVKSAPFDSFFRAMVNAAPSPQEQTP